MNNKDLPKLPDGFEWTSIRHLRRNQFFFFRKGGIRLCALIISKGINTYKVIATKPNGVNLTRNVSELKYIITYK